MAWVQSTSAAEAALGSTSKLGWSVASFALLPLLRE
jgi:hypothetical protein